MTTQSHTYVHARYLGFNGEETRTGKEITQTMRGAGLDRVWLLLWLVIMPLILVPVVRCQSDFLSIDCGKNEGITYNDRITGLFYTSDHPYVSTGETHNVTAAIQATASYYAQLYDLRSFPTGIRNCYTLPVKPGRKYVARAMFLYGNYDGRNQLPQFALYAGVNHWVSVAITKASTYQFSEVLFVASAKGSMDFCLVNTGAGTPFISALELRPLPADLYPQVNASVALVSLSRTDDGAATTELRYPKDPYDRIWRSWSSDKLTRLQTLAAVETVPGYQPPSGVLQTAVFPTKGSTLEFSYAFAADTTVGKPRMVHIFLYYAETQKLKPNESREFDISLNGEPWDSFNPVRPEYLKGSVTYTMKPENIYPLEFVLQPTRESTLPAIVNGGEVYLVGDMTGAETAAQDVDAINAVKILYKVQRNWQGDPCSPKSFIWEGLNCSSVGSTSLRIISVDLASSGLTGEISAGFGNLTQLQSLDLSRNNLTGEIPTILGNLTQLKYLDLTGNKFDGPVPRSLLDRAASGTLKLKLGSDPCNGPTSCETKKESKSKFISVVVASIVLVVVLAGVLVAVIFRRKKMKERGGAGKQRNENKAGVPGKRQIDALHSSKLTAGNKKFTYADLVEITNNFENEIGKGGFGSVYHGVLEKDVKIEVAVKILSKSSSQGTNEFQNEAIHLTRIHHRNLVSLIGYCEDNTNGLALIYEYMVEGSLCDHLRGSTNKVKSSLKWMTRLHIATEAAQGLEYLHHGCKPPIIHRDVKTNNILLDQHFEAKIADFGLCKIFENEEYSHVTTNIVGTRGYLDPEYYSTNKLTKKSDVYSFGIVLLELITGLPPILTKNGNITLVHWVLERFEHGNIEEIVDKNLQGNYNIKTAWNVLDIALSCTKSISTQRPSMVEVLSLLKDCLELEISEEKCQSTSCIATKENGKNSSGISSFDITKISGR